MKRKHPQRRHARTSSRHNLMQICHARLQMSDCTGHTCYCATALDHEGNTRLYQQLSPPMTRRD